MRYTIKDLEEYIRLKNANQAESGSIYYFKREGRNGYQAVDLYEACLDGSHSCQNLAASGTPRECFLELRAVHYEGYIFPHKKSELTRRQAFEMLKIYGIDFNKDSAALSWSERNVLIVWAKLTRYKKPKNSISSNSLSSYFFDHLAKRFTNK